MNNDEVKLHVLIGLGLLVSRDDDDSGSQLRAGGETPQEELSLHLRLPPLQLLHVPQQPVPEAGLCLQLLPPPPLLFLSLLLREHLSSLSLLLLIPEGVAVLSVAAVSHHTPYYLKGYQIILYLYPDHLPPARNAITC